MPCSESFPVSGNKKCLVLCNGACSLHTFVGDRHLVLTVEPVSLLWNMYLLIAHEQFGLKVPQWVFGLKVPQWVC